MRSELVKKRMKEVLMVDSINSSQGDFLATHVPFQKITVKHGTGSNQVTSNVSEEDLYHTYFSNSSIADRHQLLIVEGSSGAGKSHFIRWIHAKLINEEDPSEVVLLIRRSDNTLKGTIKQLLEIEEVKNIQNRDAYERLVKANQTISEEKFKYQIFHSFLAEIRSDDRDSVLNNSRRKGLYALLSNGNFEELMMSSGGPIERIFNKITSTGGGSNQDTVALFETEDFVVSIDFVNEMENEGADRKALKMANHLIDNDGDTSAAERVAEYMNSLVDDVIQQCAGIEPGDFQQIFKEIRQELKRQGKRLTLLIEDITSFTGINQALLSALITEHTGLNEADALCRLVSVVGTTTEYYKQFRDNYRDRITTQITILDEAIGNSSLIQFVAKYLNVMSLDADTVNDWMKNGARQEDYPVHQVTEGQNWEYCVLPSGCRLNLYPFTKNAIIHLYNKMESSRTPRYILREIVEPAVNDILSNKTGFPEFCKRKRTGLEERVEARIRNIVNQLPIDGQIKSNYCERVLRLVGIWGNGTLDPSKVNDIGGISLEVFKELGLYEFAEQVKGAVWSSPKSIPDDRTTEPNKVISEPVTVVIDPEQEKRRKEYERFADAVKRWHHDGGALTQFQLVRDAIQDFVFSSINWQQENVSNKTMHCVKDAGKELIAFERQDRGADKALVVLTDSDQNYQILLAFGKWLHLGKRSWNFAESETAVYRATTWLSDHRTAFIKAVQGNVQNHLPIYVKAAYMADLYRMILNGEYVNHSLHQINMRTFVKPLQPQTTAVMGHSEEWQKVLNYIYDNKAIEMTDVKTLTAQYFNLVQGAKEKTDKMILKYTAMQDMLRVLRSSKLILTEDELKTEEGIAAKDAILTYFKALYGKLDLAVQAEVKKAKDIMRVILTAFDFEEDMEIEPEDVRAMLRDISEFYEDTENYGFNLASQRQNIKALQARGKELTDAIAILQKDFTKCTTLDVLLLFAGNPIHTVMPFYNLLQQADQDVERVTSLMNHEKEALTRKGRWTEGVDERFVVGIEEFQKLMNEYREVTD